MREIISEACAPQLTMRPTPNINYAGDLDCLNYKGRIYVPNVLSHTVYLDILYTKAVDIVNFLKGIGVQKEVLRGPGGSTTCRLIMEENGKYYAIFFDVNKAREMPNNLDNAIDIQLQTPIQGQPAAGGGFFDSLFGSKAPVAAAQGAAQGAAPVTAVTAKPIQGQTAPVLTPVQPQGMPQKQTFGGPVAEDRRMTLQAFNTLIQQMVPIQGDLCPLSGKMFNPFNNQIMPDLSCPGLKINFGGRRIHKSKKLKYKKHKSKKNKSHRR